MRFLIDFYKDEAGEIKLTAVILFIIGILILYIFRERLMVYINRAFEFYDISNMG